MHSLSQQEFAELFDLKRATLGAYEEGRSNPKMDTVLKIANHFSIDVEDLLTKELTVNRLLKFNEAITTGTENLQKCDFEGIPCITEEKKDAFIDKWPNKQAIDMLPKINLPHVVAENKLAMVVDDLAMSGGTPGYLPKDTIIGEAIRTEEINTTDGQLVIVVTAANLYFRKITFSGSNAILKPTHPGAEAITIHIKDIKGLWKVMHAFHYSLQGGDALEQRLAQLENTIASLRGPSSL